jgi:hypothetical protein
MDYKIQKIASPAGSVHDYYIILDQHNCFVAKVYSSYDAETICAALKARGAPAEQTGNKQSMAALDSIILEWCSDQGILTSKVGRAKLIDRLNAAK